MRVTQNMLNNNMLMNLNRSVYNMDQLQNQLSSGRKVSKPSDDPVVAVRGMFYRSQILQLEQYARNADMGFNWLDTSDAAIHEANDVLKRVRELLVQASNGTLQQDSRDAIAQEMEQLKEHLGSIANTTVSGRYIFAGTETQTAPYQNGEFKNDNNSKIVFEMGKNIYIDVNVNGTELFASPDANSGVFKKLDEAIAVLKDPSGSVESLITDMDNQMQNFLKVQASLGARTNRIELIQDRIDEQIGSTTKLLSNEEDADLAQVITDLKNQENVHRAALGAGARILQPTLMDFLR